MSRSPIPASNQMRVMTGHGATIQFGVALNRSLCAGFASYVSTFTFIHFLRNMVVLVFREIIHVP